MTTANTHFEFREMTWMLYSALSPPAGQRHWDAVRQHYHPEARLVRTSANPDGTRFAKVMSLEAYIENVEALLKDDHFSEIELGRQFLYPHPRPQRLAHHEQRLGPGARRVAAAEIADAGLEQPHDLGHASMRSNLGRNR